MVHERIGSLRTERWFTIGSAVHERTDVPISPSIVQSIRSRPASPLPRHPEARRLPITIQPTPRDLMLTHLAAEDPPVAGAPSGYRGDADVLRCLSPWPCSSNRFLPESLTVRGQEI